MVVAPNLNDFPKADLAHLWYFSGWPCCIAGSTFLFVVFNTMDLSSFISHYFTFAYSESYDRDCHLQQKYFTENPFQPSTELLCIILSLYTIAFQRYRISASVLQSWIVVSFVIFWHHMNSLHEFFCCLNYSPESCMPMWYATMHIHVLPETLVLGLFLCKE